MGYVRPPADADDPTAAIAAQEMRVRALCASRGWEIVATLRDDPSAATPSVWLDLLRLLRDDAGLIVVVDSLECLGATAHAMAERVFEIAALGGRLCCITCVEEDGLAALLRLWSGRGERERTGEKVRDAMRRRAVKGEVLGRPPYGYQVGPRRRLESVPDEAKVVKHIFALYLNEGLGIRLIARRLNEEGYRTRRGGEWSMVTIRDILRNRVYLGTYARFGVRVPGSHTPIVSADDFRRAQERLTERRTAGGPKTVSPFLLSGLAYCGACGGRMIGVSRRQSWTRRGDGVTASAEYRYYQCGSRTNRSTCAYHTRRADDLDDAVRVATAEALAQSLTENAPDPPGADAAEKPAKLTSRLTVLDRQLSRIMDQAVSGRLSHEHLRSAAAAIARRRLQFAEELAEWERRAAAHHATAGRRAGREAALAALRDGWEGLPFDDRQALLREALERVTIHDDRVEPVLRD